MRNFSASRLPSQRLNPTSTKYYFAIIALTLLLMVPVAHAQTTATMVSPANSSTVSGTITISASINGSYASVVFWRDNWTQIGKSSSPQLSFNTGSLANGSHQFFVSVLDSAGNTLCASNIVTVTVQNTSTTATMTAPTNGSTVSGTITISASISGPYASVVFWRDNWVQIAQSSTPQISYDTSQLSNGSHQFFVSVLDSAGNTLCASNIVTVTVQSGNGPLPTPPSNATSYPNLQNQSGGQWQACTSINNCPGGGTESGSGSLTFAISNPSRSGSSMAMTSNGSYFDTMYYNHLGCPSIGCGSVGNMLEDMWFYPASTTYLQQLEFDPDLVHSTYKYWASVACRLVGANAGYWHLWNQAIDNWVATSYPCSASTISAGTWHHFQLYVTFNTSNQTYTYQTLVVDGTTVFQNLGQSYQATSISGWNDDTVSVEQEIDDNSSSSATNTVYYDNYNLWAW